MNITKLMLSWTVLLAGCSLDDRYFDSRKTDSYSLGYSTIPQTQVEEISFSSNGSTIYGVFVKAAVQDATTKTILYIHGDDKDIDKYWFRVEYLYPLGANIFIFDFQGYGKSSGSPSLSAIKQNTRDALAYIKTRSDVNDDKIIVYSFSLGGIFGTDLAANTEMPMAMITENIPASSDAVVRNTLRVGIPSSFLFDTTFDNLGNLGRLTAPTLMFHSRNDETVPYAGNAGPVFGAVRAPKTVISVEDASHSNLISTYGVTSYQDTIRDFLSENGL